MDEANKFWTLVKKELKGRVTPSTYEYIIEKALPVEIKDNIFYLSSSSNVVKSNLEKNKITILNAFSNSTPLKIVDIRIVDSNNLREEINHDIMEDDRNKLYVKVSNISNANLNPKYTFDTFVGGNSNSFALAICENVANSSDSDKGNPLFLYGGVGLGKTHLMHAIGHQVLSKDPTKNILYVTSETFTNDFVEAIRNNKTVELRQKYRTVDILMVDDVQFFSNKDSVQEELFHTFNDLKSTGKRIILSSDRIPSEIPKLEDRLKSRFIQGANADIKPPDYGTRMAILRSKAENESIYIPNEVFEYIAENITSNIRELEGALSKILYYSDLTQKPINLETTEEALKDMIISYSSKDVDMYKIKEKVCKNFNVTVQDLESKSRKKSIAIPRHIAMYLSRNLLDVSLPGIGEEFGGRDHTTVMHAIRKIEDEMKKDNQLKIKIEILMSELKS